MHKCSTIFFLVAAFSQLVLAGRYYDARVGRFLQVDPKVQKYPEWSPFNYTLDNPLKYVDPDGRWSVNVVVQDNRNATLELYDRNGNFVASYDAKANGTSRDRLSTNGDTPHGTYSIGGWIVPGDDQSEKDQLSFGPNPRLMIDPQEGEAKKAEELGRSLFRVHGGGKNEDGSLKSTFGCIRLSNDDMAAFYSKAKDMEQKDSKEVPTNLVVRTVQEEQERIPKSPEYKQTNEMVPPSY